MIVSTRIETGYTEEITLLISTPAGNDPEVHA